MLACHRHTSILSWPGSVGQTLLQIFPAFFATSGGELKHSYTTTPRSGLFPPYRGLKFSSDPSPFHVWTSATASFLACSAAAFPLKSIENTSAQVLFVVCWSGHIKSLFESLQCLSLHLYIKHRHLVFISSPSQLSPTLCSWYNWQSGFNALFKMI